MNKIVIRSISGAIREGNEDENFILAPGEMVVSSRANYEAQKTAVELDAELARQGIKWGDVIAAFTKRLGIKPCSSCKRRQAILNHVKEIGVKEALRQIKETLKS